MQQEQQCGETEEAIRTKLRTQLDRSGMSTAVRTIVRQICNSKDDLDEINPDEVIREVYKRGLMKDFFGNEGKIGDRNYRESMGQLQTIYRNFGPTKKSNNSDSILHDIDINYESEDDVITKILRRSGKHYLKMEILGGEAFLENLFDEDDDADINSFGRVNNGLNGMNRKEFRAKLKLHVFYKSQRFTAKPVECRCDPDFREEFLIEIGRFNTGKDSATASKLLGINEPLRIMVVREDINLQVLGGSLVAYCLLDWRSLLITENGSKNFPLELMGIGPEHNVCVGILQVRLSLIPTPRTGVGEPTYLDKLNADRATQEDCQRSFIAMAKRWWNEYIEIRADHQLRLIRLFAYDEKMMARPVMTFVRAVMVDDLLVTPYQAAWFVALLPTIENSQQNHNPGKGPSRDGSRRKGMILPGIQNGTGGCFLSERWQSVDSTIVSKSGTVEDHAVLLTSLFLSFGLDAYVALGTKKGKGSWAWTVTMSENQEPTCWESTTGNYYDHYSCPEGSSSNARLSTEGLTKLAKNRKHNFLTISCMFNNKGFYANVQPTTSMDYADWNLANPSKWKYLPFTEFQDTLSPYPISLTGININWDLHAKKLEFQLKNFIVCARKDRSLRTKWDDHLPLFMGQHLCREELQVSTGGSDFKDHFKTVAMRKLLPGYDFKAHTFHSQAAEGHILFRDAIEEPLAKAIIFVQGDDVKHSLKVKIFPYPEDVPSIRFMIACQYISTA